MLPECLAPGTHIPAKTGRILEFHYQIYWYSRQAYRRVFVKQKLKLKTVQEYLAKNGLNTRDDGCICHECFGLVKAIDCGADALETLQSHVNEIHEFKSPPRKKIRVNPSTTVYKNVNILKLKLRHKPVIL